VLEVGLFVPFMKLDALGCPPASSACRCLSRRKDNSNRGGVGIMDEWMNERLHDYDGDDVDDAIDERAAIIQGMQ